jgi:hypothetical protein
MPLLNWFGPYSDSWHVAVNSDIHKAYNAMHGMGVHDIVVHDVAMYDMGVHDVAVQYVAVQDVGVPGVAVHKT